MPDDLRIRDDLVIPGWELWTTTSRASGAGGQHVNTTNSRVTLHWAPARSSVLTDAQKALVATRLRTRINTDGVLLVSCESERSQHQNLAEVSERLAELLRGALHVQRKRKATLVPHASIENRLDEKRQRARRLAARRAPGDPDDDT